ncbi:PAAR domain-containing protein [Xenorhabdus beddingii]|uniref:PAAR domain-containing protein n=1 Tax=Xenorhabdus beddingii TaxID=40578 RepID=UPI001ABEF0E4|nr:PAAR domain-containing protein [Xenorhabdus beddingii]
MTVGDKTTCGGAILTGTSNIKFYGKQAALEGSTVTCGRYSGTYSITGGVSSFLDKKIKLAGTLDSYSTCPCNSKLIHSIPDSYKKEFFLAGKSTMDHTEKEINKNDYKENATDKYNSNQNAQSDEKNEFKPLTLPHVIFKTKRKMDDYEADDMKCGDLTEQELKEVYGLTDVSAYVSVYKNVKYSKWVGGYYPAKIKNEERISFEEMTNILFDEFRGLSDIYSFWGEYKGLVRDLITHMQNGEGKVFINHLLNKALKEQILNDDSNENSTLLKIKDALKRNIDWKNSIYPENKINALNDAVKTSVLPKFNGWVDRINGLVISVHDTWSTHITLKALEVSGNKFRATVEYHVQDHFGLDDNDVLNVVYKQFRIFRIWFVLQRWEKLKFKPFITDMNVMIVIEGEK